MASIPFGWPSRNLVVLKVDLPGQSRLSCDPAAALPPKGQKLEVLLLAEAAAHPFSAELRVGSGAATGGKAEADAASPWCALLAVTMPTPASADAAPSVPSLSFAASEPTSAYLVFSVPLGTLPPPVVYPLLAGKLRQRGEVDLALCLWQQYATLYPTGPRHAEGLLAQVDLLRAAGDQERAATQFSATIEAMMGLRPGEATADLPMVGYDLNRTYGDVLATYQSRAPAWDPAAAESTPVAWLDACPWPPHPRYRPQLLQALLGVLAPRNEPGSTAPARPPAGHPLDRHERVRLQHGFVRLFSAIGDRTSPRRAKLSANQARLDEISTPLSVEDLTQAMLGLQTGCAAGRADRGGGEPEARAKAELWNRAEMSGIRGDMVACSQAFGEFVERWPRDAVTQYATLALGQWLQYAGHYCKARQAYGQARSAGAVIALYAEYGLAEMDFAQGEYAAAFRRYGRLAEPEAGERMGDWLGYRRAQCLEFQGFPAKALDLYRPLVDSGDVELASLARLSLRRLGQRGDVKPASGLPRVAAYVGEDRATRGDWWTYYGSERFVLCAQHCPRDVAGGSLAGWSLKGRTGDARETMRYWATGVETPHESFLLDPVTGKRRAANWDDRGEVYARGSGPDLWLDLAVPTGDHLLSLYFVNDANYYEPDRVYVVSVHGADGSYQTGTEVRHFVNGVYKHFAVSGPAELSLRIERGLSLNALLAGVFLDPRQAPALPSCFRRQKEWEAEREGHWSPVDERASFEQAVAGRRERLPPAVLSQALGDLSLAEAQAGRFAPSYWAGLAQAALLEGDAPALAAHYRKLTDLYLTPFPLTSPPFGTAPLAKPYAEATFAQYAATLLAGMGGEEAREFCRSVAREQGVDRAFLGRVAYRELARIHPGVPLDDTDQFLLICTSEETAGDIERLEAYRKQAGERPLAAPLELALLGAYLRANSPERAVAVAKRISMSYPGSGEDANALYLLWFHFTRAKQREVAAAYSQELLARFPDSPWQRLASQTDRAKENH